MSEDITPTKIDFTPPQVQNANAIAAAVDIKTKDLKASRDAALQENKVLADALKKFDGLDADKVLEIMGNLEQSEEARLIANGKIDEVLKVRQSAMKKQHDSELKTHKDEIDKLTKSKIKLDLRLAGLEITSAIRDAATKQKLLPSAIDDAVFQGSRLFSMQEGGSLVMLDDKGIARLGSDGEKPLQPKEWLNDLKQAKPHWWPQSSGSGATGGAGNRNSGETVSRSSYENMSHRERSDFFANGGHIS